MSQNLRVALWVPIANPGAVGNLIKTTAAPTTNKRVASAFAVDIAGAGGITEAPIDGTAYERKNAGWTPATGGGGGGVAEAPVDGVPYARKDANWTAISTSGATDNTKVLKTGDSMSGGLIISADVASPLIAGDTTGNSSFFTWQGPGSGYIELGADCIGNTADNFGNLAFYAARGTRAAQTPLQVGDYPGGVLFYCGGAAVAANGAELTAAIHAVIQGDPTAGSTPTALSFQTGDAPWAPTEKLRIGSDGRIKFGPTDFAWGGEIYKFSDIGGGAGVFTIGMDQPGLVWMSQESFSGDAPYGPFTYSNMTRGTIDAPAAVQTGDQIAGWAFSGYDGANAVTASSQIMAVVDGAVGANNIPVALTFSTGHGGAGFGGGTERMNISSSGTVKINTPAANPVSLIVGDVDHNLQNWFEPAAGYTGVGMFCYSGAQAPGNEFWFTSARGTQAAPIALNVDEVISFMTFNSFDTTAAIRTGAQFRVVVDAAPTASGVPTAFSFSTGIDGGGTERLRINSAGNVGVVNGNLIVGPLNTQDAFGVNDGSTYAFYVGPEYYGMDTYSNLGAGVDNSCSVAYMSRARGALQASLAVQNGDWLGSNTVNGFDGATWYDLTKIASIVDGPVVPGSVPTALSFRTGASGHVPERMRIGSDGKVIVGGVPNSPPAADANVFINTTSGPSAAVATGSFRFGVATDGGYGPYLSSYWLNADGTNALKLGVRIGSVDVDLLTLARGTSIGGPGYSITVAGDPIAGLGVATKQYVDLRAPLASPVFTGNPTAPTPTAGDNDTSIATTAFVTAAVAAVPAAPVAATAAEYLANSATTKMLTSGATWSAAAPFVLTDGATVTPNMSLGIDFTWVIGAAGRAIANPTNIKLGQKGVIYLTQPAGGGATITSWGSFFKFPGGTKPTLSAAANAVDVLSYVVQSSTAIHCTFNAAFS